MRMFKKCLTCQANRLSYSFLGDATMPFFNDCFPGHPTGNLLQHIGNKNARTAKGWLTMTNIRVGDNVTTYRFSLQHHGPAHTHFPHAAIISSATLRPYTSA